MRSTRRPRRPTDIAAVFLLLCTFLIVMPAIAAESRQVVPTLEELKLLSGPQSGEKGTALLFDGDGMLFTAGSHGGLDLNNNGAVDLVANGTDPLWVKSSVDGDVDWVATASAAGHHTAGPIASDAAGGLFALGSLQAAEMSVNDTHLLKNSGDRDAYLLRLGSNGSVLWSRMAGGPGMQHFHAVASDADGNVYVAGRGYDRYEVAGHEGTRPPGVFIAGWDRQGSARFIESWDGGDWQISQMQFDADGMLWVVGQVEQGDLDFDRDGQIELAGVSERATFVARMSPGGDVAVFRRLAAVGQERGGASVVGLVVADNGDAVIGGRLGGQIDFDGDGKADAQAPPRAVRGYLARYSPDGGLRWARTYVTGMIRNVATDGNYFALSGDYKSSIDANQDGAIDAADQLVAPRTGEAPDDDILLLVTDGDGNFVAHANAGGRGSDRAYAAAFVPGRKAIWMTGYYRFDVQFDPTGSTGGRGFAECHEYGDLFWVRYGFGNPAPDSYWLSARAYEAGDGPRAVDLKWHGAKSAEVVVLRDGEEIESVANSGKHQDPRPAGAVGPWAYRVCDAGTTRCSNTATAGY